MLLRVIFDRLKCFESQGTHKPDMKKRVLNGPIQFESARKIWPLLELLAKLDECSLARARKIFASARMLGFSLKLSVV